MCLCVCVCVCVCVYVQLWMKSEVSVQQNYNAFSGCGTDQCSLQTKNCLRKLVLKSPVSNGRFIQALEFNFPVLYLKNRGTFFFVCGSR